MSTIEKNVAFQMTDENGNTILMLPVTIPENIDGLEEFIKQITSSGSTVTTVAATMMVNKWSGKQYSFEDSYPFSLYDIEIQPNGDSCTEAQLEAWNTAQICGSATSNSCKALGSKPVVSIPIIKVVRK